MGATLGWPTMAVLGFFLLTGLVIALAATSTARYEFERNGARERQLEGPPQGRTHPAGSRSTGGAAAAEAQVRPQSVDLAVRPAPGPVTGTRGWWLIEESGQVLAGPYADQLDADWAALDGGWPAVSIFGARRADGGVTPRPSPEEQTWLAELGEQLDRLPTAWDELLSDTDPLTTLVVEVAAALVEAGLPLHDAAQGHPSGGVVLMPAPADFGVLVSWRAHDRMSLHDHRGAAANATVAQSMNLAVADVLANLGFVVEPTGTTGTALVTALR